MSGGFLDRWSRRKLASAGKALVADAAASDVPPASAAEPGQGSVGPAGAVAAPAVGAGGAVAARSAVEAQLPAVEGLTLASDFTAFLKEEVSEALRRKALRKLFADPHFNRMDGLDIYIDDYSLPDPIPPEAMAKLKHAREWLMANETVAEAGVEAEAPVLAADRTDAGDVPFDATKGEARDETGDVAMRPDARQGGMQDEGTQEGGGATDVGNAALKAATSSAGDKAIESGQKAP